MSVSLFLTGFKPPDDKWKAMKQVYDACKAAGVDPPDAVLEFFNHEPPDDAGVAVRLNTRISIDPHPALTRLRIQGYSGSDIDLRKLPPDVTILRAAIG